MIERLTLWGLAPASPRTDIPLPGSPERSASRLAVEDEAGTVWVLERLRPEQADRRERIGCALLRLAEAGLPVAPYRPGPQGRFVLEAEGACWQLSPFVEGDPLPRPSFIEDPARGTALGRFLADLASAGETVREPCPTFTLEEYVNELLAKTAARRPDVHRVLLPVLPVLAPLFEAWHGLPHTLCQGDFHPLNVIWRGTEIGAVIDWEFMGVRPALYDAANCLGCVGIEDPRALVRGLAPALLAELRDREALPPEGYRLLPELVLGLRFAWLSEWLRRSDEEMIEMELSFMRLLANSLDTLTPAWNRLLEH
ncbi:phosphotransferase [Pseudodesulfovibrio cashew]|uniref:Phosphotransferase n=1 Tax=Pseudodesulfovibrio cashew TaxID=2678688 RepID=A0A6I6JD85_9BACT|nr:phosphotransferase [Pseudodesulfovibrio cashew]QGY39119.1 phosphotransferase [Pseudodesulfovibrio cashew]